MKVLDFGVARVIGQPPLTRVGEEIIGTPEFIAPEMMSASGELSPSVDLYALGIMLHDTVVGEPPWKGDLKEILHGHMNAIPPRLSERRRDALIPRELDDLTAQMLEKNPLKRPTASEVVEILTRIRALLPTRSVQLIGIDPIWWTPKERRIGCRKWTRERKSRERAGHSLRSTKQAR